MSSERVTPSGGPRAPVVPLEAGAGPENPPCPACGEPLFGWATAPGSRAAVRRCEVCGLGVVGDPGDREEARQALAEAWRSGPIQNRASLQARIGGSGWAAIEPGTKYLFTREAAHRLGTEFSRPRAAFLSMWQTLLNGFTFGHNLALGRLGRSAPVPSRRRWQRRVDVLVSVLAAPLVGLFALVLEAIAAVIGRGGALARR